MPSARADSGEGSTLLDRRSKTLLEDQKPCSKIKNLARGSNATIFLILAPITKIIIHGDDGASLD